MYKSVLIVKEENYRVIYYNKTLSPFLMWCFFFFIKSDLVKRIFLLFTRNFFRFFFIINTFFCLNSLTIIYIFFKFIIKILFY